MNEKRLHWDLTQEVIAAYYTVYNELGYGFLESVHKNALVVELQARNLIVRREVPVELFYLGHSVGLFRIDMLVADRVLVEVKSSSAIGDSDNRQLFNYLRASKKAVGLLLHFGPKPAFKRFVWTGKRFDSQS
ncbi:MAG: GxxExxY protein [Gemmatimonadaceae bacterium]